MKLSYLKMKNFGPFKDVSVDLKDKDIVGLLATYKSNPQKSNRAGKSFFTEGIRWTLTGTSRADSNIELIHNNEEVMECELGLIDEEGHTYTIRRGYTRSKQSLLECDWVDKKKEAQSEIDKLLGFTADEFDLTFYFAQMDITEFFDLDPAKKKEYLMRWIGNTHWQKFEEQASKKVKELESYLKELKGRLTGFEQIALDQDEIELRGQRDLLIAQAKETENQIELIEGRIARLKLKTNDELLKNLTAKLSELREDREEAVQANTTYETLREEINTLTKRELYLLGLEADKFSQDKLTALQVKESELNRQDMELDKKIRMAKKDRTGTCPVLNESCDRVKMDAKAIAQLEREQKALTDKREEVFVKIAKLNALAINHRELTSVQNKLLSKKERLAELKKGLKSVTLIDASIKETKQRIADLNNSEAQEKITALQQDLDDLSKDHTNTQREIGKIKNRLTSIKENADRITKLKFEIDEVNQQLVDYKLVQFMFSKKGIPSQEIENAFAGIQDEINYVLGEFGTGMEIQFRADRETGTWEPQCTCGFLFPKGYKKKECEECGAPRQKKKEDKLQLNVLTDGQERGFHMESGGGKYILAIATRIALTRLKQRQSGSRFKTLFLDEIDTPFDAVNKENLVSLVTNTLTKKLGFEQIFWISHDKGISESVPHTLMVKRLGSYSKVDWV